MRPRAITLVLLLCAALFVSGAASAQSSGPGGSGDDVIKPFTNDQLTLLIVGALGLNGFLIAFVVAQRAQAQTPQEVETARKKIRSLESLAERLNTFRLELIKAEGGHGGSAEQAERVATDLRDVASDLRRSIERTV